MMASEVIDPNSFNKPDIEKLYKEYVSLSEELEAGRPGGSCLAIVGIVGVMPLCGGTLGAAVSDGELFVLSTIFFAVLGVVWVYTAEASADRKVAEIDKVKPGFKEFNKEWRVKKSTEDLKATLALSAIVGLAASNVKIPNTKRRL